MANTFLFLGRRKELNSFVSFCVILLHTCDGCKVYNIYATNMACVYIRTYSEDSLKIRKKKRERKREKESEADSATTEKENLSIFYAV